MCACVNPRSSRLLKIVEIHGFIIIGAVYLACLYWLQGFFMTQSVPNTTSIDELTKHKYTTYITKHNTIH